MEPISRTVVILELRNGQRPFLNWFEDLADKRARVAVDSRLARVRDGNFGDHKSVGQGVYELRIKHGPGLRVYYGLYEQTLVVILCAGNKATQQRDIQKAKKLWSQYLDENS